MLGEVLAVLKVELLLPAFLRRARGHVSPRCGIAKYGRAELLVHQDSGFLFGHASRDRRLEAVIDHLLGSSNLRPLLRSQRTLPAEHSRLERAAVVKGLDI